MPATARGPRSCSSSPTTTTSRRPIPDFAEQYTNNQIKYATTPAALAGFQHLQEAFEKGWYQEDFGSTTYADALNMLAAGEIAHYPMLSFALGEIAAADPEAAQNIGFFGQPGTDPENHGATLWAPGGDVHRGHHGAP